MKRLALALFVLVLTSCGDNSDGPPTSATDPGGRYVDTRIFAFDVAINPATLVQEQNIALYESFNFSRGDLYVIANQQDLDTFNQTVAMNEQVSLPDLASYSYLLVRAPGCPGYYELVSQAYSNGRLTLVFNHFTLDGVGCAAVVVETYYVFKVHK